MTSTDAPPSEACPDIRVRWINPPRHEPDLAATILIGAATFVIYCAAAGLSHLALAATGFDVFNSLPVAIVAWAAIPTCVATLWHWCVARLRRTERVQRNPVRSKRLKRIVEDERGRTRLPHRYVEWVIRSSTNPDAALVDMLPAIGPGHVVVCGAQANPELPRPAPADLRFEPIEMAQHSDELCALLLQSTQRDLDEPPEKLVEAPSEPFVRRAGRVLLQVVLPLIALVMCARRVSHGEYKYMIICVFVIIPAVAYLTRWHWDWWIVPGGVMSRGYRRWHNRCAYRLLDARDSSLVVFHGSHCFVVAVEHVTRIEMKRHGWWALVATWGLLAGWLSRAPRPTKEQIESFFDSAPRRKKPLA